MIFAQIKQGVLDPYDILSKYSGLTISAATNAKASVCEKCTVILSWASGMNYLAADHDHKPSLPCLICSNFIRLQSL